MHLREMLLGLGTVLLFAGCREVPPTDHPIVVGATDATAPVMITGSGGDAGGGSSPAADKTPESCAATAAGSTELAACKWTVDKGMCVCNGCLEGGDCAAKPNGKCAQLPARKGYFPSARACLYPGQDCYPGTSCAKREHACNHDGAGHATACGAQGDFNPK